jgi:hypothetical protein
MKITELNTTPVFCIPAWKGTYGDGHADGVIVKHNDPIRPQRGMTMGYQRRARVVWESDWEVIQERLANVDLPLTGHCEHGIMDGQPCSECNPGTWNVGKCV